VAEPLAMIQDWRTEGGEQLCRDRELPCTRVVGLTSADCQQISHSHYSTGQGKKIRWKNSWAEVKNGKIT